MAASQLSHLPAIGGIKEVGRVELVYHKYNKDKQTIYDRKGLCIKRFTYIRT